MWREPRRGVATAWGWPSRRRRAAWGSRIELGEPDVAKRFGTDFAFRAVLASVLAEGEVRGRCWVLWGGTERR